jgi:flagellar basal-body rod protein FlgG
VRRIVSEEVTDYTEGVIKGTDSRFDFAIVGDGFFRIQTPQDGVIYTRDGSFTLDDQRYLSLAGVGRVLGVDGNPIQLESEYIEGMSDGTIYLKDMNDEYIESGKDGQPLSAKLSVVTFDNPDSLIKFDAGLFKSDDNPTAVQDPKLMWKTLELSNVDTLRETINMITAQRSIQSCSQMVKIYDELMEQAVGLGKI